MWRRTSLIVTFVLVSALAGAQARPLTPKAPAPPVAPVAPIPPHAGAGLVDLSTELTVLGSTLQGLRIAELPELNRLALDLSRVEVAAFADLQGATSVGKAQEAWLVTAESGDYDRGTAYLDSGRYDRAVEAFDRVITRGGKKVDGAYYWKAYALNRLGKRADSLAALDTLVSKFPASRWVNDAKALRIVVQQASGQPVSPEQTTDDDLKLIAINGVMRSDPERAIPLLEKILQSADTPRIKERALFVLAQSTAPRARVVLTEMAKGKGNPDLQLKALEYLGSFSGGPDVPLLVDVYKSSQDVDVKKRVIRSLAMTGRRGVFYGPNFGTLDYAFTDAYGGNYRLMEDARVAADRMKVEADRVRVEAERVARDEVRKAGASASGAAGWATGGVAASSASSPEREKAREAKAKEAADALWQLYQGESSVELKREILRNMRFAGQLDRLVQLAKTEGNAELRLAALQGMVFDQDKSKATETLVGLYRQEKDPAVKRQIIDSLAWAGGAAPLVQLARQETDPQLRKRLVERLSVMKDKEATDYMLEILK